LSGDGVLKRGVSHRKIKLAIAAAALAYTN
jgi:hypothetical protein